MRLQKFLSDVGFCSRRQAEECIRAGKILVNGQKATLGDKVSGNEDIVIDGRKLQAGKSPRKKVMVFYKPKGVECTLSPGRNEKTLLDFDFGPERVFPIGRLGKKYHGLLLLTNDGDLGNRLARPSFEREEEYLVVVQGEITSEKIDQLAQGGMLDKKKTAPCRIEQVGDNGLKFILYDGRDRKIRKMCEAVGLQILDLMRVCVGNILLQELQEGTWRVLTDTELQGLLVSQRILSARH